MAVKSVAKRIMRLFYGKKKTLLTAIGFFIFFAVLFFAHNARALDVGLDIPKAFGLGENDPIKVILSIIRIALSFLGLLLVILIMYSGFLWMTSGGNPDRIIQAKKILKNAFIGLLLILASVGIVSFILNVLTGTTGIKGPVDSPEGRSRGIRALGDGIIRSVYPAPGQTNVPRNTVVIVTFKEEIKADTICETTVAGACAPGSKAKDSIRLFRAQYKDACLAAPCPEQEELTVITTDHKTFVFTPTNYLGSESEISVNYLTYLTKDLKKKDGKDAFRLSEDGFYWGFSVSNLLDFEPPEVVGFGLFPAPDDQQDQFNVETPAVQAVGSVKVIALPKVYAPAELVGTPVAIGSSPPANATVDTGCRDEGTFMLTIDTDGITAKLNKGATLLGSARTSASSVTITDYFTLTLPAGTFSAGDGWNIVIKAEVSADSLTVGSDYYIFASDNTGNHIKAEATLNATAVNISAKLATHSLVSSSVSGNKVTLTARTAGSQGNSIAVLTSDSAKLEIMNMGEVVEGKDRIIKTIVKDRPDQPRNSTIQVNFSEAMNPITLSGPSTDLKDFIQVVNAVSGAKAGGDACGSDDECLSYKCAGTCTGDYILGDFLVSNQYRTVEFTSATECGMNSCGEKIYCLPPNSNIEARISAANLAAECSGSDDCKTRTPYNTCPGGGGICQNASGVNYPVSKLPIDSDGKGVADAANNSLDGNRDNNAQGPVSYYYENTPVPADGDSFRWTFFINDKIETGEPTILSIDTLDSAKLPLTMLPNVSNVDMAESVRIKFSKLMKSGTLTSGDRKSIDPLDPKKKISQKAINLWSLKKELGSAYWISKDDIDTSAPLDGYPERTDAILGHTQFEDSVSYRMQAGSGVQDIFGNCYKPSDGPGCAGVGSTKPSCCNGTAEADECK